MTDKNEFSGCPNGETQCPIFDEIRDLKQRIELLSNQVRSDFLTGLYNKKHLLFTLEQEIERTARSQQATTLIILDVDHFKSINDTHGHLAGDKVLQALAKIIQDTVRKIDIPCRYGGEEFAIVLPSSPILTGVQVAERLRSKVEESSFLVSDQLQLSITISLGVHAYSPGTEYSTEELIELADKQLYRAKESGRNKVCHQVPEKIQSSVVSSEEKDALFELMKPHS